MKLKVEWKWRGVQGLVNGGWKLAVGEWWLWLIKSARDRGKPWATFQRQPHNHVHRPKTTKIALNKTFATVLTNRPFWPTLYFSPRERPTRRGRKTFFKPRPVLLGESKVGNDWRELKWWPTPLLEQNFDSEIRASITYFI